MFTPLRTEELSPNLFAFWFVIPYTGRKGREAPCFKADKLCAQAAENLNSLHRWAGPELGKSPKTNCCRWEGRSDKVSAAET